MSWVVASCGMTGDEKSMTYGDYLILVIGQLLTLIPYRTVPYVELTSVCNARRQYRLVRIGRPVGRSGDWEWPTAGRVTWHDTRIRFFNLANALRGEIATRRRRLRDIVITAVGVTASSIIRSPPCRTGRLWNCAVVIADFAYRVCDKWCIATTLRGGPKNLAQFLCLNFIKY